LIIVAVSTDTKTADAATASSPTSYLYCRVRLRRLQAWREVNELEGRELMRGGRLMDPVPRQRNKPSPIRTREVGAQTW
jgi:hypothetical protein